MASFFDKLKKKAGDIAQGVYKDVNIWDNGASHGNPNGMSNVARQQTQQVQNSPYISDARKQTLTNDLSAPKQQFNRFLGAAPIAARNVGAVNRAIIDTGKGIGNAAANTVQTPYSAGRLATANITKNPAAANNARKAVYGDANNNFLWNQGFNKTADILSGAIMGNKQADASKKANENYANTIKNAYINRGADPRRVNAWAASNIAANTQYDQASQLNRYGLTPTSSLAETSRRVGLPIVSTGAQIALNATGLGAGAKTAEKIAAEQVAKKSGQAMIPKLAKQATGYGSLNAGITGADAYGNGASPAEALKAAGIGFVAGASMPIAGAVVKNPRGMMGATKPVVKDIAQKLEQINPAIKALDDNYTSLNQAWQTASPQMRKNIEKAIKLNREERAKSGMNQGGYIKNPLETQKAEQLAKIQKLNPMTDSYHTGIRSTSDIKTYNEAFNDPESFAYPDFTKEMAAKSLNDGKITIYSSKPLNENSAQFVTPSKMGASDYAGGGKVYSKVVNHDEVAWINGDEGQLVGNQATKKPLFKPMNQGGYVQLPGKAPKTEGVAPKSAPIENTPVATATAPVKTKPIVKEAPPEFKTQVAMQPPDGTMTKTGGDMATPNDGAVVPVPPKGKETKFASKTIPNSEFVSDKIKGTIKSPEYSVQTEKQGYTSAISRLKSEGDAKFENNVFDNLSKKNGTISRQEAIDAQTLAAVLDGGDDAAIRKATQIYEKLSEHYTAAGQLTQAAAVMARRSPEGLRAYATNALKKSGVKITPVLEKELTTLVKRLRSATPETKPRAQWDVMNFVAKNTPTSTGDKIINTWRAGLLTAPTTTGGNLLGNSGELAVRKGFVNPVATAADAIISLKTKKRTMTLGKAGAGTKGFGEGGKMLPDYLKNGYDPRNNAIKYDAPSRINTGSKTLDTYINGTYRLMGVADMPFSLSAEKEALSSIAKAEAINKGLKGKSRTDFVNEFMQNPPETAIARAQKEADYATFKNPTALGKAATGLKKPLGAVGDFIVPFTQVPASIATRIVERTPVGTANEMIKQILTVKKGGTFDQRAMSQAIGNGAFGPAIMGVGYALANQDMLTYGYPTDSKERKLWDSEGKQPYSVKVGDRWYSLNYLQPFGTLLAIGGQANRAKKEGKDISAIVGQGTATAGQSVMNQSFLKGIGGALDAISDPERSVRKYVEQTTSSTIPNFTRSFARAKDPIQRSPEGIVEGVKSGIPGLRETTTPKLDMFGQPLPAKDTFANQYLNPLKPSKVRGNETVQELRRLFESDNGVMPSEANKAVFGKDKPLNAKQLKDLNSVTGTAVKPYYDETVKSDKYKALSDEEKVKVLKKINDVVYGAEKVAWGVKNNVIEADGKKLTKDQVAYLEGKRVDFYPKDSTTATKTTKTAKKTTAKKTAKKSTGRKQTLPSYTNLFSSSRTPNLRVNVAPVKKATLKSLTLRKYTPKKAKNYKTK
jgi:hypothetical protein